MALRDHTDRHDRSHVGCRRSTAGLAGLDAHMGRIRQPCHTRAIKRAEDGRRSWVLPTEIEATYEQRGSASSRKVGEGLDVAQHRCCQKCWQVTMTVEA